MILLKQLVEVSERVAATPRKKEKTSTLAAFLRQARGKEIALAAAYLSGQVPQGSLGIGWANIRASLSGSNAAGQPLTVIETDGIFELISEEKGAGSVGRKIGHLSSLFSRATEGERDFLIRLIIGEIRQGALEGLLLDAVAEASALSPGEIRQAQMFSGDTGEVARAALEEGAAGLSRFQPLLFRPVSPMLANPAEEEGEALERLGEAAWEYKIDGARIQIHKGGDEVRVYTRSLKDVTSSVPEVVALARNLPLDQAILEGEAVALRGDGRPLPFQVTMRRFGRIQDVERMQKEIPLAAYLFDLVYAQERPLFAAPYRERFDRLSRAVPSENLIPRIVSGKQGEIRDFLEKSVRAGHEGIMGKALASPYVAGQRGYLWLKIKPAQTLDLVVLAAEWGHGRRREWLSNLHLGARDPESGQFVMLGKTFKGLTDEMLRWQTAKLLELESSRDEWTVTVRPELVVEIAFSDLQESARYPAGLALRFARVKNYRPDKSPLEADTIQKVRAIFASQRA